MELDHYDRTILSILQDDARTPFTKIAEQLGVSDATIHFRVKKMEEMGLIEKYTIIVNKDEAGIPVTTYILIRINPGSIEDVCTKLRELHEVSEVYEIHELYDVLVKVRGRDLEEIRDIIIQKIRSIPDILSSEAFTVYKTWKQDTRIQLRN